MAASGVCFGRGDEGVGWELRWRPSCVARRIGDPGKQREEELDPEETRAGDSSVRYRAMCASQLESLTKILQTGLF